MCPFFKIRVAVHRILPILDVSGAHPMALLSLIYCSSIAHLSLIYRSSMELAFGVEGEALRAGQSGDRGEVT
jgi:hypothetical protein